MNLFWKITLWVIGVVVVGFTLLFIWAYTKVSLPAIEISDTNTTKEKIEKADQWLKKLQHENYFNGAVLIIKNDSVLLKNTYGFTDATETKPLDNSALFRLASVSKQFTAAGILLLKQQQKLDLDDAITTYLPELPYTNVTIRQLLNHTSGIPDNYMSFPKTHKAVVGTLLTNQKVVALLAKENKPLVHTPNENYVYSNTGYVLLAAIIEEVSKSSFEAFMTKEIFNPLKMYETRVWNLQSEDKDFKNKTTSFENYFGNKTALKPGVLDGVSGDGSVFCSINDFEIWNQFWYGNALISDAIIQEAFKNPVLNNGNHTNYGFGWVLVNGNAVMHDGSWLGARTLIIRNMELKNCMVILDNSSSFHINEISAQLVDVLR